MGRYSFFHVLKTQAAQGIQFMKLIHLRLIRNKLVHRYDHWDDEIAIGESIYKGVQQLSDELLEYLVNSITGLIKKLDEGYK
ncbi:hypothetical protein CF651_21740 [Paenibacillus rigui]|uniref:Uncharacterized protein n=1 Tax=Paenibacillus rigui TaxID=554312 RepID=A0A229UKY3_9BACL|nr:hypothetical protein CF651_21740 [Paenibacillus rigui]